MGKVWDDDVFEAMLKAAVIQESLDEIENYPPSEELARYVVSEARDYKIRKMIMHYWHKRRMIKALRYTKKIASVFLIVLGFSFLVLLSFDEVRAAFHKVIIQIYEKYILFEYKTSVERPSNPIELGYLPDGYFETERIDNDYEMSVLYENQEGDYIIISYAVELNVTIDNEHYVIADVLINDAEGNYFASSDVDFANQLIWYDEEGYYWIMSYLDKEEILKIAKNIK